MIMGIFLISILLLTSLQTSYPSFPGIIKSNKIKFGFSSIAILTASIPLFAVNTVYPLLVKLKLISSKIYSSSSTTNIFSFAISLSPQRFI